MSESKLRIKFNEHEFEIEGPVDHVERQFELFRRGFAHGERPDRTCRPRDIAGSYVC